MPFLKRKAEKTTVVGVRLSVSMKREYDAVRTAADAIELDLSGSLADALTVWLKKARKEINAHKTTTGASVVPETYVNGGSK
jgi:hypothetical protein